MSNGNVESQNGVLSKHILPTSATMVGVCMTAVGLAKLWETHQPTHIDEVMAFDGLLFLTSAVSSYLSIRYNNRMSLTLEKVADRIFMIGLCVMVITSFAFAYSI
ncbi:MAG: hypothetical protein U1F34_08220 [Gammaproteobacteria bacterium]